MYICKDRELVYFRAPKVGSTTFIQSCGFWSRVGADHDTYLEASLTKYRGWKVVTVIRRPEDWARSFYWMCTRVKPHWERWCDGRHDKKASTTAFLNALKVTPLDWVSDESGNVIADEIYRIEDLQVICEGFGVKPKQDTNKTGDRRPCEWTEEDRAFMCERFAREYAYYP